MAQRAESSPDTFFFSFVFLLFCFIFCFILSVFASNFPLILIGAFILPFVSVCGYLQGSLFTGPVHSRAGLPGNRWTCSWKEVDHVGFHLCGLSNSLTYLLEHFYGCEQNKMLASKDSSNQHCSYQHNQLHSLLMSNDFHPDEKKTDLPLYFSLFVEMVISRKNCACDL